MESELLRHTTGNSFYVVGKPEEIADKLSSRCNNATDRSQVKELNLEDIDSSPLDGADHIAFRKSEIEKVYAVTIIPQRKDQRDFLNCLGIGAPLLRALVISYTGKEEISEVVPWNYELSRKIRKSSASYLGLVVFDPDTPKDSEKKEEAPKLDFIDAPNCTVCGHVTVRCGTAFRCHNCGNTEGT